MKIINNSIKTKYILFIFTLLCFGFTTEHTFAQNKTPKITFAEINHDFGKVEQGQVLTYQFKFKNDGQDTLEIKNVRASCGCTVATLGEKKKFVKEEKGEINVSFDTSGRTGIQTKSILVQTNDPENSNAMLSFKCEIISK